ncbi:MAG: hypothetical protein RSC93_02640 [Erysipelotrichaceae bacterium]
MATQSFDSTLEVNKKSAESFATILKSKSKTIISRKPIAKDISAKTLNRFFGK